MTLTSAPVPLRPALYWEYRGADDSVRLMKTYAKGCVWRRVPGGWDVEWRYTWKEIERRYDAAGPVRTKYRIFFKKPLIPEGGESI
jgi:hypothetical protein